MEMQCKTCLEWRDEFFFKTNKILTKKGYKIYYIKNKCVICKRKNPNSTNTSLERRFAGIPSASNRLIKKRGINISIEDKEFLKSIDKGYVDMYQAYVLCTIYGRYFKYDMNIDDIEEDLRLMYKKLKESV